MLRVGAITLGGTPDLVLIVGTAQGRMRLKPIDFKLGKISATMQHDLRESRDCKLGNITVQLSLYAFMIESLFANVVVDEAVAVFCNDGGHSEYAVTRPQDSTVTDCSNAYTPQVKQSEYVGELRVVDLGDATTRVLPFHVLGLPQKRGKGRPTQQPLGFLANQTVDTKWGPAVLVEECEGNGWNVEFGEENPGHFFLEQTEFAAYAHPPR